MGFSSKGFLGPSGFKLRFASARGGVAAAAAAAAATAAAVVAAAAAAAVAAIAAAAMMVPVAQRLAHGHGRACCKHSNLEACQFSGGRAEALEQHASRTSGLKSIRLSQLDVGLLQL